MARKTGYSVPASWSLSSMKSARSSWKKPSSAEMAWVPVS
jgi:hypothetical protein